MTGTSMRHVRWDLLQAQVADIFRAAGSNQREAELIARHLVEANLRGHDSHGIGVVPMNLKGVSTTRFNDLGSKAVGRGSIFFDGVRVPVDHRLAGEGKGFAQVMQGFDFSRALIGLQCAGAAQASLDETWAYIKERRAFDAPLAQYQGVTFPLAEAETMVAALRQLAQYTLRLKDDAAPHTSEAAMCKWLGPKTAVDVTHQCLLTHGHYGWSMDLPHQQRMRYVMGLEIGDGTAQIMKLVIARERVGRIALQYHRT